MSNWQKLAALAVSLTAAAARAETPQEAARKAMEASVARQAQAVAAERLSVARQRAAAVAVRDTSAVSDAQAAASPAPFFTLSWPALGAACDPLGEQDLDPLIRQAAQKEGLDPSLLRAVAEEESGLRACAVSQKGAMGLMQLMPETARSLNVSNPFDPQQNVDAGVRHLKKLLDNYGGDVRLTLAAYNAGAGAVARSAGVPRFGETRSYVRRITELYAGAEGGTPVTFGAPRPVALRIERDERGVLHMSNTD